MSELSIIVPVYKVEKYLHRCIDSILDQTFQDFELILIDDGSPDNSGAICDEYAARDSRIKVIHQENAGVSAARNAGLDIASGTYLGFVDSDDWIEPEMYETMIAVAKEKQVDIVVCSFSFYDECGILRTKKAFQEKKVTKEELLEYIFSAPNPIGGVCWNKLFFRDMIVDLRYHNDLLRHEDAIFLIESILRSESGYLIDDALYNVFERAGSASRGESIPHEFASIVGSYRMYRMQNERCRSKKISGFACNKFLDDCLRFAPRIRCIGKKTGESCFLKMVYIKYLMMKVILYAFIHRRLSRAKINGYFIEMIKL